MTILFGGIFWLLIAAAGSRISADVHAICLFLWLIAAVIEVHK